MATQFISVTIQDFEEQFNVPSKRNKNQRAFNLIKPDGAEAYYECILRENSAGRLSIKVYTSVRSDRNKARGVGEDAIRIVILWSDQLGWDKPVGEKPKRIHRSGGANSTAHDVVERTFKRAKEIATEAMGVCICSCGRPMVIRKSKDGRKFLGCIGFANKVCSGTRNI